MEENEISAINACLGEFLIAYNIDFECVNSNYFIDLLKNLRPAYLPPSALELCTRILDDIYINNKNGKFKFNRDEILLISDQKDSEVFVSTTTDENGKSIFIDACNNNSNKLKSFISKLMKIAKENYGVDVYAVVSDSDSQYSRPLINGENETCYWYFSCISHNMKSIIDYVLDNEFKHNVNKVVLEFSKDPIEN